MPDQIISTDIAWQASQTGAQDPLSSSTLEDAQATEVRQCAVPREMHGWRVDRVLAQLNPEFSRAYLQQLLTDGAVRSQGAALLKASKRVSVGDQLEVTLRPSLQTMAFVAQPMALHVVHEDEHLLVVNKPVGLVVHPAAGHWSGTLLNGLLAHHAQAVHLPRAGIVHRLDKDTSGLMLVAKSRQAMEALVRAIAARQVQRRYLALAQGAWKHPDVVEVEQAIGRDARNRLRMAVVLAESGAGKSAHTSMQRLVGNGQTSLLACRLHTGRTHQIRVHAAWLGCPLVGDALYGGRPEWGLARQGLHALRLSLDHPVTRLPLHFTEPPPPDMAQALEQAGLYYNEADFD